MSRQGATTSVEVDGVDIDLSHTDKTYFPRAGTTKAEVIDYYRRIADAMLPHVVDRPLVLQRFPEGIEGQGFFQKNTPDHVPAWIERAEIPTADGGATSYAVIHDAAGLVYLVNQGAITFHTLLAASDAPERPVEVIFDLDPSDEDLSPIRHAAGELRTLLDDLGLSPRVKSSGSKGLHIVVDVIDHDADFSLTSAFARRVAEAIVDRGPFTLEQRKAKRGGNLFLDVLRNAPANHAVAPYSLRPLPAAPVAVPLRWDEALGSTFHPQRITIDNVFRRLSQIDDPWSGARPPRSTIREALAAVERA